MLILLPPSEGKTPARRGKPLDLGALSFPELTAPRQAVLDALVDLCRRDAEQARRTLGLPPGLADLVARNAALLEAPTARADHVYTGVLYDALALPALAAEARRRATSRVAVVSSVFGLVRPGDRIPAYRLSGDVSLPGLGAVAGVWRRELDPVVRAAVGGGLVVDLRSTTYAAFWRPAADLARRVVTVRVLHESGGRRTVVSHFNKATKGRLVRDLLEDGANPGSVRALAATLDRLGWHAEVGPPGRHGTQVDVVVREV
ncbi:MAG: peroxide stress protein YaaA [Nocardioides sp.]